MSHFFRSLFIRILNRVMAMPVSSWILASFAFTLISILGTDLWARAGGGGNYSSGGGGSGGGGGGGGGEAVLWLLYLAIRYPQVGVPLLVVGVVVMVVKNRFNPDNTTARAIRSLSQVSAPRNTDVSRIQQKDPSFSSDRFLSWVSKIDNEIQSAWSRGDMAPVRNYLSDGLYRRFATQLAVMKYQNVRNPVADHRVVNCSVHAVAHDDHFDTIHVAIEAEARDVEVPASMLDEEAMARAAKAPMERYTEIWSFLRKPGARTLSDKGFNQGTCPNCGAPLENTQSTKCEYCQALVNSGDYDWVLAEITQTVEWRANSSGSVSGLAAMQQKDPSFNRQAAEDRASYVFWRWIEATVTGNRAPLSKCALPALQQQVIDASPLTHFKAAVGSVDLVMVESTSGNVTGARERFTVKILWSSAASPTSPPIHRQHLFVLGREEAPRKDGGLSHAHCANCLGPLNENDSVTCEYCGATLTLGKTDWVLEQVLLPYEFSAVNLSAGAAEVRDDGVSSAVDSVGEAGETEPADEVPVWAMPDMASKQERALLLMNMAAVVMADGVVTRQEKRLLKTASKRWDVPMEMVTPILQGKVSAESVSELRPANATAFLDGLIGAALVDGKIDSRESALLLDVGKHLGLADADVRYRMNNMKRMAVSK